VARLLASRASVTVLDDFSTGVRRNLPGDDSGLTIVEGSVADGDVVDEVIAGAAVVVHAAARNIIVSTRDPREDFSVNVGGTLNVLLAARHDGVDRVVYTSSCSVYGNPRYLPIGEDEPVSLLSPYAVSKFAGEGYCQAFYESYDVPTVVVRYSNVFGPGQDPANPYAGVVAKFFESALAGEPVRVHGDGEQTRDYTFVDDAVEATLLASVSPKAVGQVYNVGTGRETSVNELAQVITRITGSDASTEHVDRRDIDNIRRRVVNIEKIRRELRWTPRATLEEGLRETYRWLRDRPSSA
jgi:UDP-glucose 4-epimerase